MYPAKYIIRGLELVPVAEPAITMPWVCVRTIIGWETTPCTLWGGKPLNGTTESQS